MALSSFDKQLIRETLQKNMEVHVNSIPDGKWRTAKREDVDIVDMENGHLRNTMNMLERKGLKEHKKYLELEQEARRRGWAIGSDEFVLEGGL